MRDTAYNGEEKEYSAMEFPRQCPLVLLAGFYCIRSEF
jgi:hypothetical protein